MARRPYFMATMDSDIYKEESCEFEFFTGFAITQKRKSIASFHRAIGSIYPNSNILEVSRKSAHKIGTQLSAFNLRLKSRNDNRYYPVENIFQSSKIFERGGPYTDLLYCSPADAKRDPRLKESGSLINFHFEDIDWGIIPTTSFYDYIYIRALLENYELIKNIIGYNIFTDIEFNPKKSFNCQARSVAIFVSLYRLDIVYSYINDIDKFKTIYKNTKNNHQQLSLPKR